LPPLVCVAFLKMLSAVWVAVLLTAAGTCASFG